MTRSRRALALLAALAALSAGAERLAAQTGNASDLPPPPPPTGFADHASPSRIASRYVAALRSDPCAVGNAIELYRDSLEGAPRDDSVKVAAERRVMELLTTADSSTAAPAVRAVADALRGPYEPGSRVGRAAQRVAEALLGLLQPRGGCAVGDDERREMGRREASRWMRALRAYSDFIEFAPPGLLAPPPPELVALHDALESVLEHVRRARSSA